MLLFVNRTVCAELVSPTDAVRLRDVLFSVALPPFPVPVKATLWGEPSTESVNSREAVRVPLAVGVNVTATVQLAPAATEPPHVVTI